jgi:hypothetical protein
MSCVESNFRRLVLITLSFVTHKRIETISSGSLSGAKFMLLKEINNHYIPQPNLLGTPKKDNRLL